MSEKLCLISFLALMTPGVICLYQDMLQHLPWLPRICQGVGQSRQSSTKQPKSQTSSDQVSPVMASIERETTSICIKYGEEAGREVAAEKEAQSEEQAKVEIEIEAITTAETESGSETESENGLIINEEDTLYHSLLPSKSIINESHSMLRESAKDNGMK
ncbi:hypothetical protein RFI_06203 [Reticulomyxa filosa]|uniref:Uncharacterized protein n=1 Tax=Reticulomyxa filosa TaxID=46433 RepID=X6NX94_RETFI|nr:hypothetical protein RFI_06203 [Reticulomyxa filosa]|eukprot:ETO30920.1 hypothetical protein RFI_06203 [Reticulomyxa filosa]